MTQSAEKPGLVAVTGATGFIGGHVARRLHADGWQVRALCRPGRNAPDFATAIQGDLEDEESLARLVQGVDAVVHCAGLVRASSAAAFDAMNARATARLADAAAPGNRFILMSSLAAREPDLSPYALSKRNGERALDRHGGGLDWTVLRPPAVYGPGDKATLDFFRLYKRGLALLPGGGSGRLSLIHGEDLAGAVASLLATGAGTGKTFEVRDGHDQGYSWTDIADAAARVFEIRMTKISVPRTLMHGIALINQTKNNLFGGTPTLTPGKVSELYHDDWRVRDNPVAALTGWRPRLTIDVGFSQTVAWYRDQGWL